MRGAHRTWLAVLGGILLPLPLMWIAYAFLFKHPTDTSRTREALLIPMLSTLERAGTPTYKRVCRTDSDCDPRLRCFFSMVLGRRYCTDSRCMTDKDCPDSFTCQTYLAENKKDLIKTCSVVGVRKEGEVCSAFTIDLEYGCERGLVCPSRPL